jgi:hypothetical protein
MPKLRIENVAAVEVEIDARGNPTVCIYPHEGNAYLMTVQPHSNAAIDEIAPDNTAVKRVLSKDIGL